MAIKKPLNKIFFYLILIALPLICIELGMRIFLAIWLDPSLFWFGTGLVRTEIQQQIVPLGYYDKDDYKFKKIERAEDRADVTGERLYYGNYSKYFPGETRIDFDEHGNKFPIKMNNKGLRGPDIIDKKRKGTIRIITLGASSTFGYHDRDNETYPYYLQEILNDKLKTHHLDHINRFEVINFGIPTLKIENIYYLFTNEALALNPDLVTFYEGHNNVGSEQDINELNEKNLHNKFYKLWSSAYREISHRSLLWVFSSNLLDNVFTKYSIPHLADNKQAFNSGNTYNSMELPAVIEAISKDMAKRQEAVTASFLLHLDLINRECKQHHIVFVLANQQVSSCTFDHEKLSGQTYYAEILYVVNKLKNGENITVHQLVLLKHALLMKEIKDWALKEDVSFVDIIKALDQSRDTLLTSVHLSPRGNKIIARELADKIFGYFAH